MCVNFTKASKIVDQPCTPKKEENPLSPTVVLKFESVHEIWKFDHSNETCLAALSCGDVYYAIQGGSNVLVCE